MYSVIGTFSLEDFKLFRKAYKRNALRQKSTKMILIAMAMGYVYIAIFNFMEVTLEQVSFLDTTFSYLLFVTCLFLLSYFFLSRRGINRQYNSNAFYKERQTIIVDENQVVFESESAKTIITRDKIHKLLITDELDISYRIENHSVIIFEVEHLTGFFGLLQRDDYHCFWG